MKKVDFIEMVNFLKEARLKGYAGGGEFKKFESGFKIFRYSNRMKFSYEDKYINLFTPETFAGEEIVYFQDIPVWYMVYSGGMLPEYSFNTVLVKSVMCFLKECLVIELEADRDPKKEFWPRGPSGLRKPDHIIFDGKPAFLYYFCFTRGNDIRHFSGEEVIRITEKDGLTENDVFIHTFTGGIINKKAFSLMSMS